MASTGKCRFCGAAVRSDERKCPSCGGANENYVADTPRTVFLPKTIEELKEYCAERGMPLLRMRFFIGEDFQEPRAFGIYRNGNDFVVYKNKSDGSRSIRYKGPNEAYAVNELFLKLLEECHNRGIYPDGKPSGGTPAAGSSRSGGSSSGNRSHSSFLGEFISAVFLILLIAFGIYGCTAGHDSAKEGYYRFTDSNAIYYHIGTDWYSSSSGLDDWHSVRSMTSREDVDEAYLNSVFSRDWGVSDFRYSDAYEDYQDRHSTSSSDYDSWDAGDTDWDSDW